MRYWKLFVCWFNNLHHSSIHSPPCKHCGLSVNKMHVADHKKMFGYDHTECEEIWSKRKR